MERLPWVNLQCVKRSEIWILELVDSSRRMRSENENIDYQYRSYPYHIHKKVIICQKTILHVMMQ